MVPTLWGRLQTRVFLLAVMGSIVTALIVPALSGSYRTGLLTLTAVAVLGLGWELIYHVLMQFRWEKDWPSLFGLLTAVPEGLLVWLLLRAGLVPGVPAAPTLPAFIAHFGTVWIVVWLVANGPMRVVFIRWRFRGGAAGMTESPEMPPMIDGVLCKNGHFCAPRAPYCQVCGVSMVQLTAVTTRRPRPPLGLLLVDDGSTFRLEVDYVIGREPDLHPAVLARRARPLTLHDPKVAVSRRHALISLAGWAVHLTDLLPVNRTRVEQPGEAVRRLAPGESTALRSGAVVHLGSRWLRYESHLAFAAPTEGHLG